MVEDIWLEMFGATLQFHVTKLSIRHFDKTAYSRINVSLAAQVRSLSVCIMIRGAIKDRNIKLPIKIRMYIITWLCNLCQIRDTLFDITNGKDEHHTSLHAVECQKKLLRILQRFLNWKANHDEHLVKNKEME